MRTARERARPRRVTLVAIKATHSAIFIAMLGSILWLVATGIAGRRGRSVGVAAVLVAAESAVFVANRGVCPLTPLAECFGADDGRVSDIFLPDALARTIPLWSIPLVIVAAALHLRSWVRHSAATTGPGVRLTATRKSHAIRSTSPTTPTADGRPVPSPVSSDTTGR